MKSVTKQSVVTRRIGVSSILLVALVAVLFIISSFLDGLAQKASTDRYDLTENANRFIEGSKTLTNEVRAYAATGDMAHYNAYWKEINDDKNRDIGVENMINIGITDEEQGYITRMQNLSNQLVPLENSAMEKAARQEYDPAIEDVYGKEYTQVLNQIYDLGDEFLKSLDERSSNRVKTISLIKNIIMGIMGVIIIVLIIAQVSSMRYIRKSLIEPILCVRDVMKEIAKGDLSTEFTLEEDTSEVGELAGAIHDSKATLKTYVADISEKLGEMAKGNMGIKLDTSYVGEFEPIGKSMVVIRDYINDTISRLKEQTETVASAVSQSAASVAGGSQQLASGAQEQSASVDDMVVSVSELTSDMDEVVSKALDAESSATALSQSLKENTQKMEAMEQAMSDISNSSEGIKSIISAISNIASQTNLLALNASIEAARAGEAGKGFAVVAEEVRILSEECRDASVKTNELIEQSLSAVNRGVKLTDETFRAIEGMMESVTTTSEQVGNIAESCKEKVEVLHQIKDNFDQLSEVVRSSADTARESSEAADELNGHAAQLNTLFEQFTLMM